MGGPNDVAMQEPSNGVSDTINKALDDEIKKVNSYSS